MAENIDRLELLQSEVRLELFNRLCDKAKQYWLNCLYSLISERGAEQALHFIWKTEDFFSDKLSPIEQIFSVTFLYLLHNNYVDEKIKCFSQYKVDIGKKHYFLDFYIEAPIRYGKLKYAVELDGYEFHSSKNQVNHDYAREQDLNELGYKIIRFTGSQIYNSPFESAMKTLKIILKNSRGDKNA